MIFYNKYRKKLFIFIIIIFLITFIILIHPLQGELVLEVCLNGKSFHIPVKIGDHFNLTYKHSIFGDKVLQVFTIGEGMIILNEILTTVRVIEYSYPNQNYELIDELAHVKSLNLTVKSLQVIDYEKLEYKNRIISMNEPFMKNKITIEVKRVSPFIKLNST